MNDLSFAEFHAALKTDPRLADLGSAVPEGASFAFQLGDGSAATYRRDGENIEVVDGANAGCIVATDAAAWADFAAQISGMISLLLTEQATLAKGSFNEMAAWDAALKHLYFDHPIYVPPDVPFAPPRRFTLEDSDAEMAAALDAYGFLHVANVFTADEIDTMRADVEVAKAKAAPDDGRSWWATLADGSEVCCRVNYLSDQSAKIDSLTTDERVLRVGALPGVGLVCQDRNSDGHSVVIKYHNVTKGLADLPWHTDCGNGGHDLLCPGMNVGVQLDAANAETGQVHFLPGSTNTALVGGRPQRDWQTFAIDTQPGDLTVHMGHTWHVAPPPTSAGPGRRAVYLSFHRPELSERLGPYEAYNDVLFRGGSGRIRVGE